MSLTKPLLRSSFLLVSETKAALVLPLFLSPFLSPAVKHATGGGPLAFRSHHYVFVYSSIIIYLYIAANAAPEIQLRSLSLSLCIHVYVLQGNMRLAGELWRYVRIIHGSFETFVHSPLVFFLFIAKKNILALQCWARATHALVCDADIAC